MTVFDSSIVVDLLIADGVGPQASELLLAAGSVAAPDVIVFEVLAVLRRAAARGVMGAQRAQGAVEDLGDLPLELYSSLALRHRAWSLRDNLTAADALFVALAEWLDEPLVTKDRGLAAAASAHAGVEVILLEN